MVEAVIGEAVMGEVVSPMELDWVPQRDAGSRGGQYCAKPLLQATRE